MTTIALTVPCLMQFPHHQFVIVIEVNCCNQYLAMGVLTVFTFKIYIHVFFSPVGFFDIICISS